MVSIRRLLEALTRLTLGASLLAGGLALAAQTTLVPAGAVWRYLDNGSNQGTAWREPRFDDSAWKSGPAQLGYGDGDEATVVEFGPNAVDKYITTYFRHRFTLADRASITALTLQLKRDDGAVVYLNGREVYRSNMPPGTIAYNTRAIGAAGDDGSTFEQASIAPDALVTGENVLAVEVHQSSGTSSDISFDLALAGETIAAPPPAQKLARGPYLQLGTPTGVVVRWRTDSPTLGRVRYGTSLSALDRIVDGAQVGTEHVVTLQGLSPNTRYYYSVGTPGTALAGGDANFAFTTAPASGTSKPTRIWVLGDAGTRDNGQRAVRDAYARFTGTRATDLWLMLGDNAYESGTDAEYQQAVFDMYPETLRNAVLWPTIGNHDTAGAGSVGPTLPYFQMFTLPTAGEAGGVPSGTKNYYSFDYGNIHFVCLDSMASSRAPNGAMLTWLRADLAANTKPWVIAYWHHPPYSKGSHDSDIPGSVEAEMRQNALPILEAAGVDLVLTGHSHSYERSFLIDGHYGVSSTFSAANKKNGGDGRPEGQGAYAKPNTIGAVHEGAVYVVAGSAGQSSGGPLNHPAMVVSLASLGSLVLDVDGNRLDAKFIRETGAVADSFTIMKGGSSPPPPPPGNRPPAVRITAPADGSTVSPGTWFPLTAEASDPDGIITRVEYFLAGESSMGSGTTAPFPASWIFWTPGRYTVIARAIDNLGAVGTSVPIVIHVAQTPAEPALTAVSRAADRVELTWTPSVGTAGYVVERSADGRTFAPIATLAAGARSFTSTGLARFTRYTYRLRAIDTNGNTTTSRPASARTALF